MIDFDAESKSFRLTTSAENQSVSNDDEMLARLANFPNYFFADIHRMAADPGGGYPLPPLFCKDSGISRCISNRL